MSKGENKIDRLKNFRTITGHELEKDRFGFIDEQIIERNTHTRKKYKSKRQNPMVVSLNNPGMFRDADKSNMSRSKSAGKSERSRYRSQSVNSAGSMRRTKVKKAVF